MKKIFLKCFNYYIFIITLIIFNEFTLSFFDKTPPLSNDAITTIRKINIFIIIFFFYIKLIYLNSNLNFLNTKIFNIFKKTSYILFVLIFFDVTLKFFGFGLNKHWFEEEKIRFNTPYDMFSNKPNTLDHNKFGFRGPTLTKEIDPDTISIAFMGGSTGYTGTPPIPELLSIHLTNSGIDNVVYNFSVNSSNHNQHIHRLVKHIDYPFDVVIFYGGNNESLQYLQYDTRPSYPYNYFIKNDLSIFKIFLLRYSSIVGMIENNTGAVSGINKYRKKIDLQFDDWSDEVVNNYTSTIKNAKMLFSNSIITNKCKNLIFVPILQPVNPVSDKELKLWNKIKNSIKNNSNFINYSDIHKQINFFDNVHVDQISKDKIATMMKNDLMEIINDECN